MARMSLRKNTRQRTSPSAIAWGISPSERQHMIDEGAYYRYAQRGYTPGHELEDWLAAEAHFERFGRRQRLRPEMIAESGMAHGSPRSPAGDDKLKRIMRARSDREIPRIESMEPGDAPSKE